MRVRDNVRVHCKNKEGVQDQCTLTSLGWSATSLSSDEKARGGMEWMLFMTIPFVLYVPLVVSAFHTIDIQRYYSSQLLRFCVSVVAYAHAVHM